jgi:hypothetical protein
MHKVLCTRFLKVVHKLAYSILCKVVYNVTMDNVVVLCTRVSSQVSYAQGCWCTKLF